MRLSAQIEALLFFKNEPVEIGWLSKNLKKSKEEVESALSELKVGLADRGVVLVRSGNEVSLGSSPDMARLIEQIAKDELGKELSKASLETLSIILYKGPLSRSEIDYIRGVNSQFILRHLLVRGLIEKTDNPKDGRSFIYQPTLKFLAYLGLTEVKDLPQWTEVREELTKITAASNEV